MRVGFLGSKTHKKGIFKECVNPANPMLGCFDIETVNDKLY